MLNKLKKENKGFTIIEVMIVLAIAGLIILIVLLAIPALQRNSRNTAIKNDASALAAGVNEFGSNNDGRQPTSPPSLQNGSVVTLNSSAAGSSPAEAKVQGSTTVTFAATPTAAGQIVVRFGQKCNTSNSFTTTGNTRSTAILYNTEQSGGALSPHCLDS